MPTYPEVPCAWSENLTPPEGYWRGYGDGRDKIELDKINRVVCESSVRWTNLGYEYYAWMAFALNDGYEADSSVHTHLNFIITLGAKYSGECVIVLTNEDPAGPAAMIDFGAVPGTPTAKSYQLGPEAPYWYVTPGFDWTKIKWIMFYAFFSEAGAIDSFCVEQLHFYMPLPEWPILKILSYDEAMNSVAVENGVKVIKAGVEELITVPFAKRVEPATYTLVAMAENFDFWVRPDGTKTTTRDITIDVQADTTVEAHWKGVVQPPPIVPILTVIGAITIGVALTANALMS